jgi:hypothetical protein
MNRKEFLQTALAMTGVGFVASRIVACGGEDGGGSGGTAGTGGANNGCAADAPNVAIGTNHGHTMSVPQADVAAGTLKMYSIKGDSPHDHTVTLSPGNFSVLRSGETLRLTSSAAGHTHSITIVCA